MRQPARDPRWTATLVMATTGSTSLGPLVLAGVLGTGAQVKAHTSRCMAQVNSLNPHGGPSSRCECLPHSQTCQPQHRGLSEATNVTQSGLGAGDSRHRNSEDPKFGLLALTHSITTRFKPGFAPWSSASAGPGPGFGRPQSAAGTGHVLACSPPTRPWAADLAPTS